MTNELEDARDRVLLTLVAATYRRLGRKALLRKTYSHGIDAMTLDQVIDPLIQSGDVKRISSGPGSGIIYELTEEAYDKFWNDEMEKIK